MSNVIYLLLFFLFLTELGFLINAKPVAATTHLTDQCRCYSKSS